MFNHSPEINAPCPFLAKEGLGAPGHIEDDENHIPQKGLAQKSLYDPDVFRLFVQPGEVIEVRVMGIDGKKGVVYSGYFDNHDDFCKAVRVMDQKQHSGIYFTLQVIDPRLIARAYNRMKISDITTSDKDVLFYRWLPIDLDPIRPAGIPSSDSELKAAMELRGPVREWVMREVGLLAPITAMSGNGGHLLFRLPDYPTTKENSDQIKRILNDLHEKLSTETVKIDTSVFNPSRIWKLYGTTARKGDEVPANKFHTLRPHRKSYIDDLGGAV